MNYCRTLRDIHVALEGFNDEAATLANIEKNFEEVGYELAHELDYWVMRVGGRLRQQDWPTVDYETDYKMIRTTNVKNGFIDFSEVRYVTEKVMDTVVPSKPLVSEFMRFASDIIQQVRCLKRSTLQLKAARDLLLPRLMNGEVTV